MKIRMLIMSLLWRCRGALAAANGMVDAPTKDGMLTKFADALLGGQYLLVQFGSDVDHIAVADATYPAVGVCWDNPSQFDLDSGTPLRVDALGVGPVKRMVASAAIDPLTTKWVVQDAAGKVKGLPTSGGGTAYIVGAPLTAATADGDILIVASCIPRLVTIGA